MYCRGHVQCSRGRANGLVVSNRDGIDSTHLFLLRFEEEFHYKYSVQGSNLQLGLLKRLSNTVRGKWRNKESDI